MSKAPLTLAFLLASVLALRAAPKEAKPSTPAAARATPAPPPLNFTPRVEVRAGEVQVIALVDGICELHVTKTGVYWVNGMYAKPGLHEPGNYPTFINGQSWLPRWHKPDTRRGVDQCDPFALNIPTLNLELELIAVGEKPDAKGIEPRSPITVSRDNDELIVTIPDPEWGARWYTFALVPAKK